MKISYLLSILALCLSTVSAQKQFPANLALGNQWIYKSSKTGTYPGAGIDPATFDTLRVVHTYSKNDTSFYILQFNLTLDTISDFNGMLTESRFSFRDVPLFRNNRVQYSDWSKNSDREMFEISVDDTLISTKDTLNNSVMSIDYRRDNYDSTLVSATYDEEVGVISVKVVEYFDYIARSTYELVETNFSESWISGGATVVTEQGRGTKTVTGIYSFSDIRTKSVNGDRLSFSIRSINGRVLYQGNSLNSAPKLSHGVYLISGIHRGASFQFKHLQR